jgi:lysophospholipase L1-like esterase
METRKFFYPNNKGARAVFSLTALAFVATLSYEIGLLAYEPKSRPLHFHESVKLAYTPFLVTWSVVTLLSALAWLKHATLHRWLRGFPFLRRRWRDLVLVLFTIMVGVAAIEVGLRVVNPLGISTFPQALRFFAEMIVPDPVLRYRLRPDGRYVQDGVLLETNSVGMRDMEPLHAKPGRRILGLGDSVALGISVRQNDITFTILERLLGGRQQVDVVNTAVSSYDTVQQKRLLEMIGDDYAPDLVLLVYVENDAGLDHLKPYYPIDYWRQFVYVPRNLLLYSYIRHPLRLGFHALFGDKSPASVPASEEGWQLSRAALGDINRWCQERDIPFVVVFYPMLAPEIGREYFRLLSEAASDLGFPLIDSSIYWKGHPLAEIRISAVDAHLNNLGHALLAEGLNRDLRERYPFLVRADDSR